MLEDDVDHLIRRHILQHQGGRPRHRFADHCVQAKFLRHQTQQGAHITILVIDADTRSLVADLGPLHQLVRILDDLFDFDDELVICLIGIVFPGALGRNRQAGVLPHRLRFHRQHRGGEIGHVELAPQVFRQGGLDEIDHQIRTLLTDVDCSARIAQIHHNTPFAILATAEHQITHRMPGTQRVGFLEALAALGSHIIDAFNRRQGDIQRVAIDPGVVVHRAYQVEHHPGLVADLDHVQAAQITFIHLLRVLAQSVHRTQKIKCHLGRIGHRKTCRRRRHVFVEIDLDGDLVAVTRRIDGLDCIGVGTCRGLGLLRLRAGNQRGATHPGCDCIFNPFHWLLPSVVCRCNELCRSVHSPAES